jgi:8-oxo-dGTP diphosphatase
MPDPPRPSVTESSDQGPDHSDNNAHESDIIDGAFRPGVKALVTARGHVLLLQERRSEEPSFWTIPGGGVESGESLTESLHRELQEELQCAVTVGELLGGCAYSHLTCPATSVYTVFDVTLLSEPDPNPEEGIVEYAWFRPDDLPQTTLDPIQQFIQTSVGPNTDDVDDSPVPDYLMLPRQHPR